MAPSRDEPTRDEPRRDETGRSWAGTTLADRRARRNEQLLEAGLELLGTEGSAAMTVRAVCRGARLTERYFYESFAGREELLLAVYGRVAGEAHRVLTDAVADALDEPRARAHAAVDAFVGLLVDDPRKGRVLLLEPLAEPVLSRRGGELLPSFAALVREQLDGSSSADAQVRMTSIAMVGALINLFVSYLDGTLAVSRKQLVDHCVTLLLGAYALHAPGVTDAS